MTVTDIRTDGTLLFFAVVWLDAARRPQESEFTESELLPIEGS